MHAGGDSGGWHQTAMLGVIGACLAGAVLRSFDRLRLERAAWLERDDKLPWSTDMTADETMAFVGSANVDVDTPPDRGSADRGSTGSVADSARAAVSRAIGSGKAKLGKLGKSEGQRPRRAGGGGRASGNGDGGEEEEERAALTGGPVHGGGARAYKGAAAGVLASGVRGVGGGERRAVHGDLDQGEIIDGDEGEEVLVEAHVCGRERELGRYEAMGHGARAHGMEGDMD